MEDYPKLTVITVVRNSEQFIAAAIESVVSQNYPNLEYLIQDAASTDQTVSIIERYAKQFPCIHYLGSSADEGPGNAYNQLFAKAQGEMIIMLSADDLIKNNLLFKIGDLLRTQPELEVISCEAELIDPHDPTARVLTYFGPECTPFDLATVLKTPLTNARAIRTNLIRKMGGFHYLRKDGAYAVGCDKEWLMRLTLTYPRVGYINEAGCVFTKHKESLTTQLNFKRAIKVYWDYVKTYLEYLSNSSLKNEDKRLIVNQLGADLSFIVTRGILCGDFVSVKEAYQIGQHHKESRLKLNLLLSLGELFQKSLKKLTPRYN